MKLNIGCGEFYATGWLNLDLDSCPHRKDLVCDVLDGLPFPEESVERVYLGHVLEHLPLLSVVTVLFDVRRVLKVGGQALVVGPDLDRVDLGDREAMEEGGHRWPGDEHRWAPTAASTLDLCRRAFPRAAVRPLDGLGGWPLVSEAPWQCAVLCER